MANMMPAGYADPTNPPGTDKPNTSADSGTGPGTGPGGLAPMDEKYYLNANPDAAFFHYLAGRGYNLLTPGGKYAQNQQQRTYNEYQSEAAKDPNLGFYDWLMQRQPDYAGEYMSQSPEARGDFSSRIYTPRARWVQT